MIHRLIEQMPGGLFRGFRVGAQGCRPAPQSVLKGVGVRGVCRHESMASKTVGDPGPE